MRGFHELLHRWRGHVIGGELFDHLCVLDAGVHALLVPVDQFLDRTRQVLVGRDHRHQRANVEPPDDRQVTTHQIEQEWRDLREQVVQELDHELALEVLETDQEQTPKPGRELGTFVVRGVVGVYLHNSVHTFGDTAGQLARSNLPLTREHQKALAHLGNDDRLHQHHAKGHHSKIDMLEQNEEQSSQGLATQVQRRDQRLAHKTTEWLDFVLDHCRHFGRLDAPEVQYRKAQNAVEQVVTQAAQHAFAHPALHGIDLELDQPADDNQRQKGKAQCQQVRRALQRNALENLPRAAAQEVRQAEHHSHERNGRVRIGEPLALDRLVDDDLG